MSPAIVLAIILGAMVVAFVAFYLYSRKPEWGDSEVRKTMFRMMVIISPLWGMHYREPYAEIPVAATPGPDREPLLGQQPGEDGDGAEGDGAEGNGAEGDGAGSR